jgi:Cu-Zn family superoxide dismutase
VIKKIVSIMIAMLWVGVAHALIIPVYSTESGKKIGVIKADNTIYGLLLTPNLRNLPQGVYGFHIHEGAFCTNHGMGAGGHLDPENTEQHNGPYRGNGHLGDLPVLIVDAQGKATLPVLAPRLKLGMITGHTIMIHAGSDNYSDQPEKLGGGGARIACGVIPYH